jgi:lipid-A-disaccharide synthase
VAPGARLEARQPLDLPGAGGSGADLVAGFIALSSSDPYRVFISAGERSGDVHAANLIRAIRDRNPSIAFEGFGGPRMKEAGCLLHRDMLDISVMWTSFFGHLFRYLGLIRNFYWLIREKRPRVLVLVDYPGLNFILARLAKARKIPVVYYICPQIWAWAPWRRPKILRLTDLLMVILPFEVALYRNPKTPVTYVGHPLADELLKQDFTADAARLRSAMCTPEGGKVIGIFPGSRKQEVHSLMPLFRNILEECGLDPARHRLLVSSCRKEFRAPIEEGLQGLAAPFLIEEGDSRLLMAACDFALVASGTASLELAYFGKPMVVLYRVPIWELIIYQTLSVNAFISLVNILGREEVVPEKVVKRARSGDLGAKARELLEDTPARSKCLEKLAAMREGAFKPGGVETAARTLLEFLEKRGGLAGAPSRDPATVRDRP